MKNVIETSEKTPLGVAADFFQCLDNNNIQYCQWKSSANLGESLRGENDLDVLVDRRDAARFEHLVTQLGFKRVLSQPWAIFPGIEDWIGFDEATGKMIHVHLHYWLWAGHQYAMEYHLPWESLILETAVVGDHRIKVTNPNIEIILLAIRTALKTRYRDRMKATFSDCGLPSARITSEFNHLYQRIDEEELRKFATLMLGNDAGECMTHCIKDRSFLKRDGFRQLRRIVPHALSMHRRFGHMKTFMLHLRFALYHKYMRMSQKLGRVIPAGKHLHTGGVIIALVGIDGSGKSTVTAEIKKWLKWKLAVRQVYFGTGDGHVGPELRYMNRLMAIYGRRKARNGLGSSKMTDGGSYLKTRLRTVILAFHDLLGARHRIRRVLSANDFSQSGGIVIADRYPQSKICGMFDGPPPPPARKSFLADLFFKQAFLRYKLMDELPPDVVVRLHVPVDTALKRKPDHNPDEIARKADALPSLSYDRAVMVEIDVERPLDEVVLDVKKAIWAAL